jgi:O-antigen ligase
MNASLPTQRPGAAPTIERVAYWLMTASLGMTLFNLLVAQVLFGIAALLWLWIVRADGQVPEVPPFFWPLAGYAALTLVSAAVSSDPRASFVDSRQLVLFLIVPAVVRLARGSRAMTTLDVIMALGAAGAFVGVVEYTIFGFDNLDRRPTGSLSHYMTYSGLIMLVLGAAVARLLFYPAQRIWPAVAIPALAVALAATQTRNAYLGALAAIACLLPLRQVRLLLAVPVLILLFVVAAPAQIRDRAFSIADLEDASNRDRVQMLVMGRDMVRDHPLFGVGPEMVGRMYGRYLQPDPVHTYNPHLHNVPVQIAAERGLPALAAWLWFVATAAWGLLQEFRRGPAPALAAAGLGAIVAMLVAGLFEYNFGDSEFMMLFLALISLPYAARAGGSAAARSTAVRQ